MKMADYFFKPIPPEDVETMEDVHDYAYARCTDEQISLATCHAINCYDDLVAMLVQLQTEGGLGVARHRQIDRLLAKCRGL